MCLVCVKEIDVGGKVIRLPGDGCDSLRPYSQLSGSGVCSGSFASVVSTSL